MARPKKQVKLKEPIKIRLKSLADGNKSIYLDIYWKGVRKYEYLNILDRGSIPLGATKGCLL